MKTQTAAPWRIEQILTQLGGAGLSGAICYTGGHNLAYHNRPDDSRPDPSEWNEDNGTLRYQTGMQWRVNMKRSQTWKMFVTLEPSDTYTVRLLRCYGYKTARAKGRQAELYTEMTEVYCDMLQGIVENMYDKAVQAENSGFIPLW